MINTAARVLLKQQLPNLGVHHVALVTFRVVSINDPDGLAYPRGRATGLSMPTHLYNQCFSASLPCLPDNATWPTTLSYTYSPSKMMMVYVVRFG
jgi:hypothetical protein